jgi:hypothetical protein
VTLDAPLVQVGGLTANLLNSQTNPEVWRKEVGPTQKIYSWAMNNHWGTNYRAFQEGPHVFRFLLRPHRGYDPAAAARLAIAAGQPLLPIAARGGEPMASPLLEALPPDIVVSGLKPSDDGQGLILRHGTRVRTSPATRRHRGSSGGATSASGRSRLSRDR